VRHWSRTGAPEGVKKSHLRIFPDQGTMGAPYLSAHFAPDVGFREPRPFAPRMHRDFGGLASPVRQAILTISSRSKRVRHRSRTGAPGSHQRTWISCYAASDRTACAAFIKESRMQFDNATNLDRKSSVPGTMMICFHRFRWTAQQRSRLEQRFRTWGTPPVICYFPVAPCISASMALAAAPGSAARVIGRPTTR
jgi:hypothetical protein